MVFDDANTGNGNPGLSEQAQRIAIAGLGFIAADDKLLQRFLAISGIEPDQIRAAAGEPGFLAGVLGFIAAHEPTLLEFSDHSGIPPQSVMKAIEALPGGSGREWLST